VPLPCIVSGDVVVRWQLFKLMRYNNPQGKRVMPSLHTEVRK